MSHHIQTYLATSREFQPIVVEKTVNGVVNKIITGIQYVAVRKGQPLSSGTLKDVETLDGDIGFYTDQLAPGYWEIGIKTAPLPERPFISCGIIRIK